MLLLHADQRVASESFHHRPEPVAAAQKEKIPKNCERCASPLYSSKTSSNWRRCMRTGYRPRPAELMRGRAHTSSSSSLDTPPEGAESSETLDSQRFFNDRAQHPESRFVGASDTYRAAAVQQLDIWSQRVDVPIVKKDMGSDPASVAFDNARAFSSFARSHIIPPSHLPASFAHVCSSQLRVPALQATLEQWQSSTTAPYAPGRVAPTIAC